MFTCGNVEVRGWYQVSFSLSIYSITAESLIEHEVHVFSALMFPQSSCLPPILKPGLQASRGMHDLLFWCWAPKPCSQDCTTRGLNRLIIFPVPNVLIQNAPIAPDFTSLFEVLNSSLVQRWDTEVHSS